MQQRGAVEEDTREEMRGEEERRRGEEERRGGEEQKDKIGEPLTEDRNKNTLAIPYIKFQIIFGKLDVPTNQICNYSVSSSICFSSR